MNRPTLLRSILLVIAVAGSAAAAQTLYVSPDVPTDPDGVFLLPWEIVRHDPTAAAPYAAVLNVPGQPAISAIHRMDRPGNWLFSVEAPNDLAGLLTVAEPREVIRYAAGLYSKFFCGGLLPAGAGRVPPTSSIDAIYLDGGDGGELIVSFDTPTPLGGFAAVVQPSALVRYVPTGGGSCADWQLIGFELDVAAVAAGYFPVSANVTGADRLSSDRWLLSLDIPTDLAPLAATAPPTFLPGHVVVYDASSGDFDLFEDLQTSGIPGWQISGQVDALSCGGNPGKLDPSAAQILFSKAAGSDIIIDWSPGGCSAGAENYGIYEGEISVLRSGVYDYAQIDCDDAGHDLKEQVTPAAPDSYYVVVPYSTCGDEGSYGTSYVSATSLERPPSSSSRCAAVQTLTACP